MRLSTVLLAALAMAGTAGTLGLISYRRAATLRLHEGEAVRALLDLVAANENFRARDRDGNGIQDYWTGDVAGLFDYGGIDRAIAMADAKPLRALVPNPVPREGYYFVVMKVEDSDGIFPELYQEDTDGKSGKVHNLKIFGFCAYPAEYGVTGTFTYYISDLHRLCKIDTGGKPVVVWPKWPHYESTGP